MPGHVRKRGERKDGSIRWQARWRHPGDPRTRREQRFRSKREAERWLTTMETDALRGTYTDPRKSERPLAEAATAWRGTWGDLEPKTRAGYEAILERHILPRFGRAKLGSISTEEVQRFVNELAAQRAPNTVRRVYSVLRAVLRVAVEHGYLTVNPCDAVKLRSKKRAGVRRAHLYLGGSGETASETHCLVAALMAREPIPTQMRPQIRPMSAGIRAASLISANASWVAVKATPSAV